MNSRLSSLALVAALTTAATAQTGSTAKPQAAAKRTTSTTHHTAATTAAKPASNIPKVVGIPKILYALKYVDIKVGTGPLAEASILGSSPADSRIMQYTVKYTGWLTSGTKFDSSDDHPGAEPFAFPAGLHRVIQGWDSGFTGMHVGGKRRLFIPWQLAYGEAGKPPVIPAKSDLIFDIELVKQEDITAELVRRSTHPDTGDTVSPTPRPQTPPDGTPPPTPPPASQPSTPPQPETPPHPQSF